MEQRCPTIGKIRKFIGFEPSYDLEAIIRSVIDYFKE
jgi:nucleoside-diphosphate-sugar epimerase